ncbi:MAG: hypothetical protein WBI41_13095 [Azovibrio sp.]|uniref:hypothetical protein n=1 Tax=Azovibrio sp. TaxID=1872673 RepID=UPI003C763E26
MQRTGSGSQAAPTPSGTPIAWSELEAAFAPERLAPYLNHLGGDRDRAVALYLWNIALCESLYPLLNLSEITLRNRFHQVLSQHFQRQHWYDDAWLDQRDASKVLEAKQKIARHRLSPTPGRVVAELTFGFWANTWRRRGHARATQGPHRTTQSHQNPAEPYKAPVKAEHRPASMARRRVSGMTPHRETGHGFSGAVNLVKWRS